MARMVTMDNNSGPRVDIDAAAAAVDDDNGDTKVNNDIPYQ